MGAETRPHSVHTQHVCGVRSEYICTKHHEKRPRTTSWRGRISGVGFAAKLVERSNSIDRAWASLAERSARQTWGLFASGPSFGFMFSYCRSTTIRTLSAELVWVSVGRLLRLRQEFIISVCTHRVLSGYYIPEVDERRQVGAHAAATQPSAQISPSVDQIVRL